jgi:hypothetical protein
VAGTAGCLAEVRHGFFVGQASKQEPDPGQARPRWTSAVSTLGPRATSTTPCVDFSASFLPSFPPKQPTERLPANFLCLLSPPPPPPPPRESTHAPICFKGPARSECLHCALCPARGPARRTLDPRPFVRPRVAGRGGGALVSAAAKQQDGATGPRRSLSRPSPAGRRRLVRPEGRTPLTCPLLALPPFLPPSVVSLPLPRTAPLASSSRALPLLSGLCDCQ